MSRQAYPTRRLIPNTQAGVAKIGLIGKIRKASPSRDWNIVG